MKGRLPIEVEKCRVTTGKFASDYKYGMNGLFLIPDLKSDIVFRVIASDGKGWDHVSVSLPDRCPTWEEMAWIKDLFFEPMEAVFQFHPPRDKYINHHKYCLHLWKPQRKRIKLPPTWMVGPK